MIVNPGIRRFLGSAIQRLFNSASFSAPLTHTLVPERGTGSPTFTRASTATFRDWEGVLRTVPSGCARFEGARMVRNLLSGSENIGIWVGSATVTTGVSDPNGGTSAFTITTIGGGTEKYLDSSVASGVAASIGAQLRNSVYIRRRTGTGTILMYNGGSGPTYTDITASVTSSWQRVSTPKTAALISAAFCRLGFYLITAGDAIDVWHPQSEDVTGQADQTASEYVSVGVLSAPYHGAGVDGVEFFNTDRDGALLSPQPAYLAEGARTNLGIRSNEYNSWTDVLTPSATQNLVGPDGATSGWTFTDNDPANIEYKTLNTTLTAATHTESVFAAKTVGATTFPVIFLIEGTRVAVCTIDTNNGIATAWTAYTGLTVQTSSARCSSFNSAWWRVELTFLATAASWVRGLMAAGTTNATQSTGTIAANVTGSTGFFGSQIELGSSASSYIPTTTTAGTRAADVLTYQSAGNIDGTVGWCYAEVSANWSASPTDPKAIAAFQSSIDYGLWYLTSANNLTLVDGAAAAGAEKSFTILPTTQKVAATWSSAANSSLGSAQGVIGSADTFGTAFTPDQIGVGIYRNGTVNESMHWNGHIRNVRIGQRQLSASELQAITAAV